MGAPIRSWVRRALVALVIAVGGALVLTLPVVGAAGKAAMLAAATIAGCIAAFREFPAFDPLGRVCWRLPQRPERTCAITFDDGPCADTPRVVEILERHGVKGTFFVLAANAQRHPAALRLLIERGHTVAIHGMTHRKIHRESEAAVARELDAAAHALGELGAPPVRLYRPPHGLKRSATLRAARERGYEVWAWSRGIWDTDRPAPEILVKRATRMACSRMVLLLHDGRGDEEHPNIEPMLAALPRILDRLRADGFTFATLDRT